MTPSDTRIQTDAVVFSGSGCSSTAAYGVGVLRALAANQCAHLGGRVLRPSVYSGSAFGAFNAAIMTANGADGLPAALDYLETAWLDGICGSGSQNGVYRIRLLDALNLPRAVSESPAEALGRLSAVLGDAAFLTRDLYERLSINLSSSVSAPTLDRIMAVPALTPFFDMAPLRNTLHQYVSLDRIRTSAARLFVTASDWQRGGPCVFVNSDMTVDKGHDILQASAAYLLMFPFVEIGGRPFGGAPGTMATPLRPVLENLPPDAGRTTVHTIFLDMKLPDAPTEPMPGAFGGMGRYFNIHEAANITADYQFFSAAPPSSGHAGGPVEIHHYRPGKPIADWFGFVKFARADTAAYIAQGYADTIAHDCKSAGCVIPPTSR